MKEGMDTGAYYNMSGLSYKDLRISANHVLTFEGLPKNARRVLYIQMQSIWQHKAGTSSKTPLPILITAEEANTLKAGGFNEFFDIDGVWFLSQHGLNIVTAWLIALVDGSAISARFSAN